MAKHRQTDELFEDLDDSNLEALYSPDYLKDCAGPDARAERLQELKRRIEARAYSVDPDRLAEEMLLREDLSS